MRIALIKPSALGDIVHALPVLGALRHRFPHAHITWVVNRSYEPLLHGHPALDATLPFDRSALRRGFRYGFAYSLAFGRRLRAQHFDLVIDLQGLLRTGLMTAATGARHRFGFANAREGAAHFYTDRIAVPDADRIHAVDRYWRVAEALGAGDAPRRFDVPLDADALHWADERLAGYPRPWLVLGVGARWLTKRWPPEHFATLTRTAQERWGGTAVFIGAPDEAPLARTAAALLAGPSLDVCGKTTLPQLAALLARADAVIANDTGPLHLTAALGRPVVAPYTCTRIRLHGPYGGEAGAVPTQVACAGSYLRNCDHRSCMTELTPDRLRGPLFEVLSAWPTVRQSA